MLNIFDTSRSLNCVWFRFQCVSPLSLRKQKQSTKLQPQKAARKMMFLKDGLGPDQEMLSYPIKFSKENIFTDTTLVCIENSHSKWGNRTMFKIKSISWTHLTSFSGGEIKSRGELSLGARSCRSFEGNVNKVSVFQIPDLRKDLSWGVSGWRIQLDSAAVSPKCSCNWDASQNSQGSVSHPGWPFSGDSVAWLCGLHLLGKIGPSAMRGFHELEANSWEEWGKVLFDTV